MALSHRSYLIAMLAASTAATPAMARNVEVTPYIEVGQVVSADLDDGGDVLTYSSAAAGVDATVATNRTELQLSYRYERRIDWQKPVNDEDVHTGLARGRFDVVPNMLSLEAGAIAARGRSDMRGSAPTDYAGNVSNTTQVYSAYAGPSFATQTGALNMTAAYRLGYTKVESSDAVVLPGGQPRLDSYDDSVSHFATASIGMAPDVLPVGWTVSGGWERETAGQLSQRFDSKYVRGDLTIPITPTVAVVGGVGYEDLEVSQRDALLDGAGDPVFDSKGRLVTDPTSPRRLAYDQDGLFWDAGVMWRPSPRTSLEARAGKRYGSMTYFGSFSWQPTENSGVSVGVFDTVETFGQQLNDNLSLLPTHFNVPRNRLVNGFAGCTFGGSSGGCMNDALQSVTTAAFRSRGVAASWSATQGRLSTAFGAGYVQRKYLTPAGASYAPLAGVTDETWYAQGTIGYELSRRSSLSGDIIVAKYDSGILGAPDVFQVGGSASLLHNFSRALSGSAAVGVNHTRQDGFDSDTSLSGVAALRYSF